MVHGVYRLFRFALLCVAGLFSIVIVFGIGSTIRLLAGPIDAPVPQELLDRLIAEAAPGWEVSVNDARFDFSTSDGLSGLKLSDVVLADPNGSEVINVPVLGLRFAMRPSLEPSEMLAIREVVLGGASLDVVRDENGAFQLALGDVAGTESGGDAITSLGELARLKDLPQLRIEDAQVHYTDLARGTTWRTEKARLTFAPNDTGITGTLAIVVDGGIGGAQLEATHNLETGKVRATLALKDVRPSRVAELDPLLAELARIDAPLSGEFTIAANDGGAFESIAASLKAANGTVVLDTQPMRLNAFSTAFKCDVAAEKCDIDSLSISTPELQTSASGTVHKKGDNELVAELNLAETSFQNETTRLTAKATAIKAEMNSGVVRLDRAQVEGLFVTRLPSGISLEVAKIGGATTVDPQADVMSLPALTGERVVLTDAQGVRQTLGQFKTSLSYNRVSKHLTISSFDVKDITGNADGLSLQISNANGSASADLKSKRITLAETIVQNARVKEASSGLSTVDSMTLSGKADLETRTLTDGTVEIGSAALSLPDLYPAPVALNNATARIAASFKDEAITFALKEFSSAIDGLPARAEGRFALRSNGTVLGKVTASLGSVAAIEVPQHWPNGVAPGGLRWFAANVKGGTVDSLSLTAQFDEARPEADALNLHFAFSDALATFAPNMPPIQSGYGKGHVTLDRIDVTISEGHVETPQAGTLKLGGSSFAIPDFAPDIPDGEVKLRAQGHVQSVLRFLDDDPINAISPTGFNIAATDGNADVQVFLHLPLSKDLRIDDVQYDARAKIYKYALVEPETNLPISGDLMTVKATPEGLTLQSDARVEGLNTRLGYSEGFKRPKAGEPNSILTVESILSLEDFARHGVELDEYADGLTAIKARVELFDGGAARVNADADLTNATLKADQLGWAKPSGVPATIRMSGYRNRDGRNVVEAIALRGEDMIADGSIAISPAGRITQANFNRIKLGSAIDTGLIFGRRTDGRVGILLKGSKLDLRNAFADALEGDSSSGPHKPSSGTDTDINVQISRVLLRDDLSVFDMMGGIWLRGDDLRAANISGKLNGSASAKLLAERRSNGVAIRLTTPDAGAFIRATDVFTGAYDGSLVLDAIRQDNVSPARISGRVLVNDMVVHDAPTLGRIFSGGAIGTLMSDLANGGIKFSKLELPFEGIGSKWQIQNGVAYGPQLGLTLDGGYDVSRRDLMLNGSVSPAYAINGALGNVPLLGSLLTGGEGGGVFGVTFSVDGDTDKPVVSVNPLSALAPGFLRKIVAGVGKGEGKAPIPKAGIDK